MHTWRLSAKGHKHHLTSGSIYALCSATTNPARPVNVETIETWDQMCSSCVRLFRGRYDADLPGMSFR
jgi:hypothetical protein